MTLIFSGQTAVSGNVTLKKGSELTLIETITSAGLTSGLKLCLDAGDVNSYPGLGQDWLDTSGAGNGDEFHLGADTDSDSADPTFNGVAGSLSENEYFVFDSNDFFRYGASNETWMEDFHKVNAKFTIFFAYYFIEIPSGGRALIGTDNASPARIGINWLIHSSEVFIFHCSDGDGSYSREFFGSSTLTPNAWHLIALSIDEAGAGGNSFFWVDGNVETFDASYAGPTTSNSTFTLDIGASGDGGDLLPPLTRFGAAAIWSGVALTEANLDIIWNTFRNRFNL